ERNKFLASDRSVLSHLISQVPERTCLSYVEHSESNLPFLSLAETRYYIDLADFGHSLDGYLASFSGKHRKNLRHDLQRLSSLCPSVHFNRLDDYDRMAQLNIERFGDESFFKEPFFYCGFRRFLELAKNRGELRMISIDVGGVTQSVEVAVQYNGEYSVLMGGTNIAVSNVGKLMVLEHIKHAIENKAGIIDFLATDSGWKRLWNMKEEPVYYFANYDVDAEEAGKNRRY
ncbi:MAG: GNAT family N-acetyltransferase, partial [Candidatus Woesearchaeota archaeon]